ncbi:putative multicopper oxidase [Endogone sp. FLAS-F59071]|nr:putative multicopper oxidase [Endogone sp. FLAS-F59071]|eukprot:RUS16623.1 putative multicopper oxidase [Endogone sp. FLAS-F59071]
MRLIASLFLFTAFISNAVQQAYIPPTDTTGVVRRYYIAAEEVEWDYAPSGYDLYQNQPLDNPKTASWTTKTDYTIGTKYLKALYRQYTDATFKTPVERPAWMGYLGPIFRAEVGDKIEVNFWNRAQYNFSVHPHGVLYTMDNEGALYEGSKTGSSVPPNGRYKYTWSVPERSGPGPADLDSMVWGYHSHVSDHKDLYAGLTGAIIIYKKGLLDSEQDKHKNLNKEFVMSFLVVNENQSQYFARNVKLAGLTFSVLSSDRVAFEESNRKRAINGRLFNNLDGIDVTVGDRVRFYLLGWGSEVDLHTVVFHGNTLLYEERRVDTVSWIELLPATFRTVDMNPDNVGKWLIHCGTENHAENGMSAYYTVHEREIPAEG